MTDNIVRRQIPEIVVPGKPLGRHVFHDPRSLSYPADTAPAIRSVLHRSAGLPLDQGNAGSCTGNALCAALNTVPHWKPGQPTLGEKDAVSAYSDEEVLLGYGPYPPNDNGGSGTEVCQAGKNRGWLSAYQTAIGITQALLALVNRPVITGVDWYDSFDQPDSSGRVSISPGAQIRGGHEFCAIAIDALAKLVWFPNSWGPTYGVAFGAIPGGCFCMTFDTWDQLLQQQGDVTVPRTAHGWVAAPLA